MYTSACKINWGYFNQYARGNHVRIFEFSALQREHLLGRRSESVLYQVASQRVGLVLTCSYIAENEELP